MKLYHSIGPNPRLVRMFLIEKGIELPAVDVDIIAGENRQSPFLAINPSGSTPVLMLDSGEALAETTAICEYLEELHPQPPLIGSTPEARARTRMWTRRIDLAIVQPMTHGFRAAEGLPMFKERVRCLPQAADDLKATAREGLAWLEARLGERPFVAGDALTLADIVLYSFVEFGALVGQGLDAGQARLSAWRERMASRDSAKATA
ncbi:glutathione S-transferase family protein [Piscinibacter sp.]|uniref:glutathione S-transferase family protein n=1 Tax=Piscinibacter sp. TaxID=1903157 RepID=UPI002CB4B415|nr:glutathione S-transferase family protein [Albitalea sp.]HUG21825.1 glutathione S-transferase family protein [Albitalea sp.]